MEIRVIQKTFEKIRLSTPMKALLISDLHFSPDYSSYFSADAANQTWTLISRLIDFEDPSHLFILGDWSHESVYDDDYATSFLSDLYVLPIPIYILGGNHDRDLICRNASNWTKANVHVSCANFFQIKNQSGKCCWLTHDGGNGYWLEKSQVLDFITSLKKTYALKKDEWLILGHTHYPLQVDAQKVSCLGNFNIEGHNQPLSYGIITTQPYGFAFTLKNAIHIDLKVN